jgi:hypothetical protein
MLSAYCTIACTFARHPCPAVFKMVWYVLLRPLRPELDGQLDERLAGSNAGSLSEKIIGRHSSLKAWSANLKMVRYVLLRPRRPEVDSQDVEARRLPSRLGRLAPASEVAGEHTLQF